MLIKLEDCILIFDEAHNMEDAAREASSLTVNNNQLKEVEEEMDKIRKHIDIQALHNIYYKRAWLRGWSIVTYACM